MCLHWHSFRRTTIHNRCSNRRQGCNVIKLYWPIRLLLLLLVLLLLLLLLLRRLLQRQRFELRNLLLLQQIVLMFHANAVFLRVAWW